MKLRSVVGTVHRKADRDMVKKKNIAIAILNILLFLFVTACAPTAYMDYIHPTKTEADFNQDRKFCAEYAEQIGTDISCETMKCLLLKYEWKLKPQKKAAHPADERARPSYNYYCSEGGAFILLIK